MGNIAPYSMFVQILLLVNRVVMKKCLWSLLFFMLFVPGIFACINEYFPTEPPKHLGKLDLFHLLNSDDETMAYWRYGLHRDHTPVNLRNRREKLLENGLKNLDFQSLSDYASIELKIGDKKAALRILDSLYKKHPQEYNIVANLGTAYELVGNDSMALLLIRKAVDINAASHYRSEWIHVKILEQKIATNPDYSKIIGLGIKDFTDWIVDDKYNFPQPPDSLKLQIAYQLHERISFVAPPNPIVAQLVLDFADIVAKHDGADAALPFYDYAAVYGKENMSSIVSKRKEIITQTKKEIESSFRRAAIIWAIPLLAFVLIFFAWLRSRKKNRES